MKTTLINTLRRLEGVLRSISSSLWVLTVDDPDTATAQSEAEGMTPLRRVLSALSDAASFFADMTERLINRILKAN